MSRQGFGQLGCVCRDTDFVSRRWHSSVRLDSSTTELPSVATGFVVW